MLNVKVDKAINLKGKEALFVSFPYDTDNVAKIKSLPVRYYITSEKAWEVPVKDLNVVIDMFAPKYEIKLVGKVNTKVTGAISNVLRFGAVDYGCFEFKTDPFEHQLEGFEYGMDHERWILGDDPGLGKTKQVIDIAVARKSQFKHCLIVCGVNGLKYNWLEEISVHSDEKGHVLGSKRNKKGRMVDGSVKERLADLNRDIDAFFLITNIETLRDEAIALRLADMCASGVIGMVAVDEAHKAKNPQALQTKGLFKLQSYFRIAMTGTPLMNNPLDLYAILHWIGEEHASFYKFKQHFCDFGGFGGHEIIGYKHLPELRARLEKVMLRRRKDILNLPPKIRSVEYVEMNDEQWKLYDEIRDQILDNLDLIAYKPNPLTELLRLRQVTGAPGLLSSAVTESAKMDRLEEMVEELVANGKKCLVYSNWADMVNIAAERLQKYSPMVITGESVANAADRIEMINTFQKPDDKHMVIVGTIGALGTGLTITAVTEVIFLDKPWNPANRDQAEDRCHRIGTTGTVNVRTLVCKGTIDERIEKIIEQKGDIFDQLVNGNMSSQSKRQLLEDLLAS